MNIVPFYGNDWVPMLVNCKECEAPLVTLGERVKGVCKVCECQLETPDVFDPYGQPIVSEVAA